MSSMPAKGKYPHHQQQQHHHHHQQQQQQHHQQQQQQPQQHIISQSGVTGTPQPYNAVVASRGFAPHAGSDFHVPGQNFGAQPGAQVGGGAGSIGVPGGRGPPSLANLTTIGQPTTGIQPTGQQQPPQVSTPGVQQQQQQQGPTPTTTPPVHTPSSQEMGKQAHLQAQQPAMAPTYGPNQNRAVTQGYYPMGARQQQPRNLAHRGNQAAGATHVVGMPGVAGSPGQPTALYTHHGNITTVPMSSVTPMFVPGPGIHSPHQQINFVNPNQLQQIYPGQQRHQAHHGQQPAYYPGFQSHTMLPYNITAGYSASQPPPAYYYPTHPAPSAALNLNRASANAVSGAGQNVAGPLAGAQGTAGVPQGTLQQATQQPQTIAPMAIALTQPAYAGHNGVTPTPVSYRKAVREHAIVDIVDPQTGLNVAKQIYSEAGAAPNDETKNRETPQPQSSAIIAEFASRVAKAASESSETTTSSSSNSSSNTTTTTPPTATSATSLSDNSKDQTSNKPTTTITTVPSPTTTTNVINQTSCPSITNSLSQLNLNKDSVITQCNKVPVVSSSLTTNTVKTTMDSQSTAQVDSSSVKIDSKQLSSSTKEFKPRTETNQQLQSQKQQTASIEEQKIPALINKDNIPIQQSSPVPVPVKRDSVSSNLPTPSVPVPTIAAAAAATGESSVPKNISTSPSRRKTTGQQPLASGVTSTGVTTLSTSVAPTPVVTDSVASSVPEPPKEQKEQGISETVSVASRGATPTPVVNQAEHYQKNGENSGDKFESEKSADGKSGQKQKSKKPLKGRDINRKGSEKEGSDMDAFVNTVQQPETPELKKEINDVPPTSENVCEISVKEKQVTEAKPDTEVDKISQKQKIDDKLLLTNSEHVNDCTTTTTTNTLTPAIVVKIENKKNEETTIEDSNKSAGLTEKPTKDVVDHANVVTNILTDVEALVAQKNEENAKVSIINSSNDDKNIDDTSDSNEITNDTPQISSTLLKYTYSQDQWSPQNTSGKKIYDREFLMKLQDDPQSRIMPPNLPPMDFVQRTSNRQTSSSRNNTADSRNLFNRDSRAPDALFPGFAKTGLYNPKMQTLPGNKKSYQGNKKPNKPNVIHVSLSLHEDVKLRESENAWKPTRVKNDTMSEDEAKTQALYKKVRSVLNKLTPQKFDTLVDQVKSLQIDTHERLQGVIDLVFQKAVDEPNFSVAYALMCKQLAQMQVAGGDNSSGSETKQEKDNKTNFRLLILTRCQHEFESNTVDEEERNKKLKEIEDCTDPEKKKELATALEDADRRLRMKSVGNIRFVGELYKQGMIRAQIMNRCIDTLLQSPDDENLECLSKLLTTIGQTFENGGGNLSGYFDKISQLSQQPKNEASKKISSRIRFALRDLVDLRNAKWKPRRDAGNPKTMDQVVKDAESERLDIELNNTPRKDDRNLDRRRNRGGNSNMDDGWSTMPSKSTKMPYSVEASKLNAKVPTMEDIKLGGRNQFMWGVTGMGKSNPMQVQQNKFAVLDPSGDQDKRSIQLPGSRSTGATRDYRPEYKTWDGGRGGSRNGSHQLHSSSSMSGRDSRDISMPETTSRSQSMSMPTPSMKYSAKRPTSAAAPIINKPILTETQLENEIRTVLDGCKTCANADAFIESAMDQLSDKLDNSTYPFFVSKSLNAILERTSTDRARYSALLAHMINNNMFPLSLLQSEYDAIWKEADDLSLDLPKFWTYAAEILVVLVVRKAHPLAELKRTTSVLKSAGYVGKLVGELFTILAQSEGPKWLADKWTESGLQLSDLIDPSLENADDIIKKYNLGFLTNGGTSDKSSPKLNLTIEEIHQKLLKLLRENTFDDITSWVTENIGDDRSKEPQFIRKLVTSILQVSISEPCENSPVHKLDDTIFKNFLPLITRYVENEPQLELQCLYAINAYYHKLMYPQGVLGNIVNVLSGDGIISSEAFFAWQESKDPAEMQGHSIAVTQLTSFFVDLKEGYDSSEDA